MIPPPYSEPESGENQIDIRSDRIRIIYSSVPMSLVTILINSGILSFILWGVVAHTTILTWFGLTNLFSLFRFWLYKKFQLLDVESSIPVVWEQTALFSSIVSGSMWGSACLWLFPENDIAHQVFLAFVIAGMCAGAVSTLSSILSASVSFVILCLVPLAGQFLLLGTDIGNAMTVMSTLFLLMILVSSKSLNRTITESLLIRNERNWAVDTIQHQAFYDELTNLPNRRFLTDHLKQDLARSIRHHHYGAVLFVDLDHFKAVNDSLGHAVGDELLRQVSSRVRNCLRDEDTVGRLGGDEFVILISEAGDELSEASEKAQEIAEKILNLFVAAFVIQGNEIHMTVSIGISMYPFEEMTSDEFLQRADVAMYQAKEGGRNAIRQFLPEMQRAIEKRREVEKGLRQALEKNELELYYQPIVNSMGDVVCAEALLRWNHPERGVVAPAEFIEIAEKTGLITLLGDWVLLTACQQLVQIAENSDITISINVSPHQFSEPLFTEKIKTLFNDCSIDPKRVRLEITEGMMLQDVENTIEKIQYLKSLGLGFSIDDFGTGYSSLSYLKQLPIDMLKIDKSFVHDIDTDPDDAVIVETIIAMARHLNIGVVAEGVETEEALSFLKSKGCQNFQGYLFARPMPFIELMKLIS